MDRERLSTEQRTDETVPDWGTWSNRRAVAWSALSGLLVVALVGVAMGGLPFAGAMAGTPGDAAAPVAQTPTPVSSDFVPSDTTVDRPLSGVTDTESTPTWTEYDAVVVFRNDDIQPYYRQETMRAVDQVFIDEDVPVTLGVIPQIDEETAITETDLCSYLRSNARAHPDLFEFSLHGYTHEYRTDFAGGSEFGGLDPNRQRAYIDSGTRTLTECVGERPTTFVPPMDSYDDATVEALAEANYTVVSGGGWFVADHYGEKTTFQRGGLVHVPNDGGFVASWTTGEFHDAATLEQRYDWTVEEEGLYVQMLHYQDFTNPADREQLRAYIQYIKASGDVRFMTLGELGERTQNGTIERTESGWRIHE